MNFTAALPRRLDFVSPLLQFPAMSVGKSKIGMADGPIVRRKLSDHVLDRLKALIAAGDYRPGQTLPSERELMASYGVGRPAIREAMQALANAGLISIKHGERAKVQAITAKTAVGQLDLVAQLMLSASPAMLENLKDARRFFERGMVREAALRADANDVESLENLLETQAASLKTPEAFIDTDRRFHTRLVAISKNPILDAVAEAVLGWLCAHQVVPKALASRGSAVLEANGDIVAAVRARDALAADAAMLRYLDLCADLHARTS